MTELELRLDMPERREPKIFRKTEISTVYHIGAAQKIFWRKRMRQKENRCISIYRITHTLCLIKLFIGGISYMQFGFGPIIVFMFLSVIFYERNPTGRLFDLITQIGPIRQSEIMFPLIRQLGILQIRSLGVAHTLQRQKHIVFIGILILLSQLVYIISMGKRQ